MDAADGNGTQLTHYMITNLYTIYRSSIVASVRCISEADADNLPMAVRQRDEYSVGIYTYVKPLLLFTGALFCLLHVWSRSKMPRL